MMFTMSILEIRLERRWTGKTFREDTKIEREKTVFQGYRKQDLKVSH
jgi:hypothetical protein